MLHIVRVNVLPDSHSGLPTVTCDCEVPSEHSSQIIAPVCWEGVSRLTLSEQGSQAVLLLCFLHWVLFNTDSGTIIGS